MAQFIEKNVVNKNQQWDVKGRNGWVIGEIRYYGGFAFFPDNIPEGISQETMVDIVNFLQEKNSQIK